MATAKDFEITYKINGRADFSDVENALKNMRQVMDKLTLNDKLQAQFKDLFTQATSKLDDFRKQLDNGILDARGLKKFETTGRELANVLDNIAKKTQSIGTGNLPKIYSGNPAEIAAAQKTIDDARQAYDNMATAAGRYRTEADQVITLLKKQQENIGSSAKSWGQLIDAINKGNYKDFEKLLKNIEKTNLKNSATDLKAVQDAVHSLAATGQTYSDEIIKAEDNLDKFNISAQQQAVILHVLQGDYSSAAEELHKFVATQVDAVGTSVAAQEAVDQLGNKLKQLLSVGSGIALLRRSVRNAYNTIKELDAAMTETATVTDYSVSQMWQKLDDYTNIANQLGATTLGTYKTITLFFQQGLDEQQSLALATETMKMARVAGIDYAEATEYMTSALRGFNMELNETSATRVNDVYSELAKITAADTNQIAIAMSKVASLANSANMELETTSAFLAQIIETTQEAPETAGTALKTIIARFSEVKKLFSEGDITGTDENGDVIDVNKIGAALRNVGIDLNQYIAGNVGLDQIFLELAEKWEGLSLVQQRYIATQAAGSRQQSRFIAMMQNYSRTMELVDAAYNSAGSGQEQFEKTLESLEAKLNNLHNAWNSFSMSIANSNVIKGAVDLFTELLQTINNLTDAFGPFSGAVKLFLGFGLFKAGNTLLGGEKGPLTTFGNVLHQNKDVVKAFSESLKPLKENLSTLGSTFNNFIHPIATLDNEIIQLTQRSDELSNMTSEQRASLENYDQEVAKVTAQLNRLNSESRRTEATFAATGNTLSIIGGAVTGFGVALKQLGLKQQNEQLQKTGEIVSYVGSAFIGLGQVIAVFPKITAALNVTTGALVGLASGFLLLAAGIGAAIVSITKYHQHTQDLYNSSDLLIEKINTVNNSLTDLFSLRDGFEGLEKGSLDWYLQLDKVKEKLDEIYETDPEMKKFLRFNEETGEITFDRKGYEEYSKNQRELSQRANIVSQIHGMYNPNSQQYENTLDNSFANEYNSKNTPYDYQALAALFGLSGKLSAEDVGNIVSNARTAQSNWSEDRQRSFIAERTGQTDIRNDELANYFIETFIAQMLESLKNTYTEEALDNSIKDKRGQNIEQQNQDLNYRELGEQYDLALLDDEDAAALETYWERLNDLPQILQKNANLTKELALDTAAAVRNFDDFAKVIKDNQDNLENLDKSSLEYQKSLGAVVRASEEAFGFMLDPQFIEDNLTDFVDAFVNGVPEAIDRLREKLFLDIQADLDPTSITLIEDTLEYLAQDRSFQLTGTANLTQLFEAVNSGMEFTAEQLQLLQDDIQKLGFELAIDTQLDEKTGKLKVKSVVLSDAAKIASRNYSGGGGGGRSSGGGSSKKEKPWENPYDQLYNLTERNEEAIRRRNILEKQYNAILRDREGTSTQLLRNSLQELANLQEQLSYQRQLQRGRQAQLNAVNSEMYMDSEGTRKSYSAWGVTKYAKYNQQTNAIEIDWDAIDKVTDEQTGKAIEDYVKRLEELQKQFEQVDSDILDIEEEIDEINQRGKGEYLDFEQRVYDAIVQTYQDVIDSFSSLNDTINDSNDKILNDLQEQIDLERQIRDNTKTEEEIGDKETRLAYLQRDTSGANATEILKLQEEIADARQNYTDNLIDQKLSQLAKDNDAAAEQRQTQITIMQEQLDYWTQIGAFWSRVDTLLSEAINEDGSLKNNSDLVALLMNDDNFGGLSKFGKQGWEDDLVKSFMESMEGYGKWMIEEAEKKGEVTQDGNTYKYNKDKKAWMLGNEAYSAVYNPATQRYEFTRVKDKDVQVGTIGSGNQTSGGGGYNSDGNNSRTTPTTTSAPKYKFTFTIGNWSDSFVSTSQPDAVSKAVSSYQSYLRKIGRSDMVNMVSGTFMQGYMTAQRYKRGGLADFTGPAWLDGSKSQPEAVLSAKQTEMFISLRDLLEHITQSGGLTSNSFGNTYVDLDVNADIGSDYDVDSLVNRLKRDILESSNYRNVNALTRGH